jgi:hypothetical protein
MFRIDVDVRPLLERAAEIEKRHIPFVAVQTTNDAMFDVRAEWQQALPKVFDRPTPFTLNSVLYRKATLQNPVAEVFLRDEISDGIPPAKYLDVQVRGGQRAAKRSETLLRTANVLGDNEFVVPAVGAPLDQYGNLPGSIITAILSDVQASFDPANRSTRETRARRARRNRKREGSGVYFYNAQKRGKLPRGIYERRSRGFVGPSRGFRGDRGLRMILAIVGRQTYQPRYNVFDMARRVFHASFQRRWQDNLNRAVAGIKRTFARRTLTGPFA